MKLPADRGLSKAAPCAYRFRLRASEVAGSSNVDPVQWNDSCQSEHATINLYPYRRQLPSDILSSHLRHQPVPPVRALRRESALAVVTRTSLRAP